jgi:hypothetical protein
MSPKSAARERTIRRIPGHELTDLERSYGFYCVRDIPLYWIKSKLNTRQKQTARKKRRIVSAATRDHSRFIYDRVLFPANLWTVKRN